MATLQKKGRVKRGRSGLEKTLDEFKDCTWMKYKKIKEDHSHEMREKLKTTMESYRTDKFYNPEFPSVGNILSILYLTEEDADHVKKAEETNREVLENFPDNMSALFVKVQILMFRDEFTEANVCIEKMKAITSSSPMFQSPTEEMKKLKEHECFSRADHAFYLMQLGPKHYTEAVPMLKDAISFFDWQMDDATPSLSRKYHIIWSFLLIKTYNRLISSNLHGTSQDFTPTKCFDELCLLLPHILRPQFIETVEFQLLPECQGMMYMELYDAFTKIHNKRYPDFNYVRSIRKAFKLKGGKKFDKEDWLLKAYELAPDNGHVLERLGRHYRAIATNMDEFQVAVDFLCKCVELYPQRHVALHQLSSCYRSMWYEEESLDEAYVHNNEIRLGLKDKKYGNKKKRSKQDRNSRNDRSYSHEKEMGKLWQHQYQRNRAHIPSRAGNVLQLQCSGLVKSVHQQIPFEKPDEMDIDDVDDHDSGLYEESVCTEDGVDAECDTGKIMTYQDKDVMEGCHLEPQVHPQLKGRDIAPNKPVPPGEIMKHYSKPDRFDVLRANNPVTASTILPDYLDKAIKCLEKANEVVKGTVMRYVVDLARLYLCAGCTEECIEKKKIDLARYETCDECVSQEGMAQECMCKNTFGLKQCGSVHPVKIEHDEKCYIDKAKKIFEGKAKKCPPMCVSDHDKAYYKEQYALFLEKQLAEGPPDCLSDDDYQNRSENIKLLFQQSVIYSIQAREKSRIAFYHLRDILKTKVETGSHEDRSVAKEELALLEMWGANFSRCKDLISQVLKENPEAYHIQWQLVYSFARNKKYHIAYQYMKPLLEMDKIQHVLQYPMEEDCPDTTNGINCDFCLTVAFRSAEIYINSGQPEICQEIYRCIFNGILALNKYQLDEENTFAADEVEMEHMEVDDVRDILIIAEEDVLPLEKLENLLNKFAGLHIFTDNDIPHGHSSVVDLGSCKAKAIIIPVCVEQTQMWLTTLDKVLENKCQPKVYIRTESDIAEEHFKCLPKVDMTNFKHDMTDHEKNSLLEAIFRAMLVEYHDLVTKQ